MNAPSRRPSSPLTGTLVAIALLFGGWHLASLIQWHVWGLGVMGIGLLALIAALIRFLSFSFQSAHQINLLRESRKLSYAFGHARMAREEDGFIRKLAAGKHGFFIGALGKTLLFYDPFASGHGHMLTYAPSRTGKTISVVIPALLHWFGGSLFVTDVKGELTAITAQSRKMRGQSVLILNPFGVLGIKGTRFNPLHLLVEDILKNQGKALGELARTIAFQLIPERVNDMGDGRFFRSGGRRLIIAMLLHMAVFTPGDCHLPNLRKLIWSTSEEKRAIAARMQSVEWFGGLLRDYGNMLADLLEPQYIKTFGAFRDNAMEALEIYDANTDFAKAAMDSDFALEDVLSGKTTLYVILPESKLESHGNWMGLVATLLMETVAAAHNPAPLMMMLEEMGNLGRLPNITKALSLLPGKNLRCWMIFQSRRQPMEIYGAQTAGIIEEQSSLLQAWSIRNEEDRKAWSARIGTTTKKARSLSHDPNNPQAPWRLSVNERAAPVLSPDQIRLLGTDAQLIALDGQPVILGSRVPYFQIEPWRALACPSPYHGKAFPKDKPVRFRV